MIMDSTLEFAEEVATGSTGTNLLGDVVDLQTLGNNVGGQRDVGNGQPMYVFAKVATDIEAGAAGTIRLEVVSASDEAITTDVEVHVASQDYDYDGSTNIDAGTVLLHVALPLEGVEYGRYLAVREVVSTSNTTAGAISAFLVFDPHGWKAYPQADVGFPA